MAYELFQTDAFRDVMRDHLYNVLAFVLENDQEFAVAAEVEHILITPDLPRPILDSFGQTALFVLSGYTFQSAFIDEDTLYFEAGFGEENIGADVTIPFLAIRQVFVGEYPIALNIAAPAPYTSAPAAPDTTDASQRSMQALLNNPENQKLLKNNKK